MSEDAKPAESIDERAARVLDRLGPDEEENKKDEEDGKDETGEDVTGAAAKDSAGKEAGEDAIAPPVSWSDEEKETFRKLPREAQSVVARREGERDRMLSQRAQDLAQRERALEEQRRGY